MSYIRSSRTEAGVERERAKTMIVDLLYFAGCPNHEPARSLVQSVLTERGIEADIREIEITDGSDAQAQRFLGSPTVRVDGVDVDPSASTRTQFGLMCRVYWEGHSATSVPTRDMIVHALRRAAGALGKSDG
jgi:hypothetical protein